MTQTRKHICDTEDPQRPCCWAARRAEMDRLQKMDDARIAKYGTLSCHDCGAIYSVDPETLVVEDHAGHCKPLSIEEMMSR